MKTTVVRRDGGTQVPQMTATLTVAAYGQSELRVPSGFARPALRTQTPLRLQDLKPLVREILDRVASETGVVIPMESVSFGEGRFTVTAPPHVMARLVQQPEIVRSFEPREPFELN